MIKISLTLIFAGVEISVKNNMCWVQTKNNQILFLISKEFILCSF